MKKNGTIVATFCVIIFGVIGVTLAYYRTNNSYTNEFDASKYKIKTEEVFESPTDWKPGDVTPKTVNVKNEGTIDAAVKVCFEEKWEDKNGNSLPLVDDYYGDKIVGLKFSDIPDFYWRKDCYSDCYYYYKKLEPGETTENLLESVIYFGEFNQPSTIDCVEDPVTHSKTCNSRITDYNGAKYTLDIKIETVQYPYYQNAWGNLLVKNRNNNSCENFSIKGMTPNRRGVVAYSISKKDNKNIFIKDSELDNFDLSSSNCRVIYADSISEENKYNMCDSAIYIAGTNYQAGVTIPLEFSFRMDYSNTSYESGGILYDSDIDFTSPEEIEYSWSNSTINLFPFADTDLKQ